MAREIIGIYGRQKAKNYLIEADFLFEQTTRLDMLSVR